MRYHHRTNVEVTAMPGTSEDNGGELTAVSVQLNAEMLAAVDRLVDHHSIETRPEAIRLILKRWLTENQMLRLNEEGKRPEELNASNDG